MRAEPLDLGDDDTAREMLALQRDSYAVEAQLIGSDAIPALRQTLEELKAAPERWLAIRDGQGLVGGVAYERLEDGTLDICKLVVAPRAFRKGVASALLDALAAKEPAHRTIVSTGKQNHPALRLYERRGFTPVEDVEVAPGLWITRLLRVATGRSRFPTASFDGYR